MENKEEVKLKYHVPGSVTFRNEFHMVEKGVVAAATHFGTLEHSVFIGTAVAMRYVRRRAWILATNFTQYFHVHIEDPGMSTKLYSILGFENAPVQGAVLQLWQVPHDSPHDAIESYSDQNRFHQRTLLRPETTFRESQARERFQRTVQLAITNRPEPLRRGSFAHLTIKVCEEAEMFEQRKLLGEAAGKAYTGDGGVESRVAVISGSMLEMEVEDLSAPMARGGAKKKGGKTPVATPHAESSKESGGAQEQTCVFRPNSSFWLLHRGLALLTARPTLGSFLGPRRPQPLP